ncbi:MAG: ABC transporter ATP-binding protein [Oscillospiraceae bacterium]|jgi:ABC-2 type transport system ATP-binding protein
MTAITIQNLTKCYGKRTVVDHLNLSIVQGQLFSLLGVNGAGKTTVIKLLSCLTKPTEGDACLMGHSIRSHAQSVKSIIGISPQETAVAPNLNVRENLEFIAGIYGIDRLSARDRATEMIETFSLGSVEKQKACTLSGGWKHRLSIAMALVSNPQILFLDEPTLGLDVLARRELWERLKLLRGHHTIVLTTHYLEEAEALSDHIAILADGKFHALGTADELKTLAHCDNFEDAFVTLASRKEAF